MLSHLPQEAQDILIKSGAFQEGHFKLSSGLHSSGYLQCALILQYPEYAEIIAQDLGKRFQKHKCDVVLTPALGGIVLGQELARVLKCRAIFAERQDGELSLRRGFYIKEGERVLLAEDVVTTGGSVLALRKIAQMADAKVVGYTVVCDRSGGRFSPPEGIEPWITLNIETYSPEACPLCARGAPIQKPGSRWKK
ncbi:orotate phosphoribosyltransferase [Candidatus Sumerlaeota bacterium]|nr:orotate phosphoribosyltransferase [Candidatus Sumerlaeota bacterium]